MDTGLKFASLSGNDSTSQPPSQPLWPQRCNVSQKGFWSGRNPIEDFLNDVIQEDTEANVQDTWKTYWQRLVLEDCGFDLAKVEAKLRE